MGTEQEPVQSVIDGLRAGVYIYMYIDIYIYIYRRGLTSSFMYPQGVGYGLTLTGLTSECMCSQGAATEQESVQSVIGL